MDTVIKNVLINNVFIDSEKFLWLLPQKIDLPRIPGEISTPHPMEYIATEEVAEAMLVIVKHTFGISIDDLMAECALVFGFERRGPKIKSKLESALNYLTVQNKIKIIEQKIQAIGG